MSSDPSIHTMGLFGMEAKLVDDRYTTIAEYTKDMRSVVDSYTRNFSCKCHLVCVSFS